MLQTVGSYEAENNFSALLDKVEGGESFAITRRGAPVALLVRLESVRRTEDVSASPTVEETILAIREHREKFAAAFAGADIKELIAEGRR